MDATPFDEKTIDNPETGEITTEISGAIYTHQADYFVIIKQGYEAFERNERSPTHTVLVKSRTGRDIKSGAAWKREKDGRIYYSCTMQSPEKIGFALFKYPADPVQDCFAIQSFNYILYFDHCCSGLFFQFKNNSASR